MDDLVEQFEAYADWVGDKSPLYERVTRAGADDDLLLDIAGEAREGQPGPETLLAAVHALLLQDSDHPLARFYPTCGGDASARGSDVPDEDPFPAFREFCASNEDRLRELVATRRTQTNDVGRSAALVPAFERVARTAGTRRLALVEIGASAGLNLCWDRYAYEYGDAGTAGSADAPVRIECELRGDGTPPLPETELSVERRVGVDLNPLDVTDPADARWLRALVHPGLRRRHERLDAAIEIARDDPPDLVAGDAIAELPALLDEAPDNSALVVFSTYVLYQLDDETIGELRGLLAEHSRDQPVYWLSLDPEENRAPATYRLVRFAGGDAVSESQIAEFDPYGDWIRWLDG
ncbi:MAG TPA: DUF2332 domain-containing protein [Natronoarchaeum rubrum]|nr:DUF2332 domain-containing protein [Natronoarchaeum rubrum]